MRTLTFAFMLFTMAAFGQSKSKTIIEFDNTVYIRVLSDTVQKDLYWVTDRMIIVFSKKDTIQAPVQLSVTGIEGGGTYTIIVFPNEEKKTVYKFEPEIPFYGDDEYFK